MTHNRVMIQLADGAIRFAEDDLNKAGSILMRCAEDDHAGRTRLRNRFATRRLESAKLQIDAAIALLRE